MSKKKRFYEKLLIDFIADSIFLPPARRPMTIQIL